MRARSDELLDRADALNEDSQRHAERVDEITGSWKNRAKAVVVPGYFHATPAYDSMQQMRIN